jgi:hypothetical protein
VVCGIGCRELLFNQRCGCHEAEVFPRPESLQGMLLSIVINRG